MESDVQEKVAMFFAAYPVKHYLAGEVLVQAGDEPAGIFYLAVGQIRQYDISPQGIEVVVNVFKQHAFFPMNWAVAGVPNRYFYETAEPCDIRLAPPADVQAFLKENPVVLFDLLKRVYRGVDGMQRRMAHLMGGSASSRVAFELVISCKRFGTKQADGSYKVMLHEDELARRSGLSRETVNRELSKLKSAGMVSVSHQDIIVNDLSKLEASLGEDL